ncbi:MAG TPA: hypothetical protein VN704_02425 [Verrucomicrobiae bacterium]|nr:hypothetical protein [Verrucomicrobiae bacterium]
MHSSFYQAFLEIRMKAIIQVQKPTGSGYQVPPSEEPDCNPYLFTTSDRLVL